MPAHTGLTAKLKRWPARVTARLRGAGRAWRARGSTAFLAGDGALSRMLLAGLTLAGTLAAGYLVGSTLVTLAGSGELGWETRPLVAGTIPPGQLPESRGALTAIDIFHRKPGAGKPAAPETEEAAETTLDLKLTGLRTAGAGDEGSAIIRTPDHDQRAYKPGEEILPDVRLRAVRSASVLLERDDALEALYLSERARRRGEDSARAGMREGDGREADAESEAAPARESNAKSVATDDIAAFLETVTVRARMKNGRMAGLRVTAPGNEILLKRNGLIPGDVLLAVSGIEITSPARAEAALEALSGASRASVVIERDGRERTLSLALDG